MVQSVCGTHAQITTEYFKLALLTWHSIIILKFNKLFSSSQIECCNHTDEPRNQRLKPSDGNSAYTNWQSGFSYEPASGMQLLHTFGTHTGGNISIIIDSAWPNVQTHLISSIALSIIEHGKVYSSTSMQQLAGMQTHSQQTTLNVEQITHNNMASTSLKDI